MEVKPVVLGFPVATFVLRCQRPHTVAQEHHASCISSSFFRLKVMVRSEEPLTTTPQTLIKKIDSFSATSPLCFVKRPALPRANNKSIISFALSSRSPPSAAPCSVTPDRLCDPSSTTLQRESIPDALKSASFSFIETNQPSPPFNPLSDFQTHRPTWALWCCGRECVPRCRQHGWSPGSSGYRADGRPCQSFGRGCWRHRSGACPWPAAATPTPGT